MAVDAEPGKSGDEFDATRVIVRAAEQFDETVRLRIFRLAAAALGLKLDSGAATSPRPPAAASSETLGPAPGPPKTQDIKTFLNEKRPSTDKQKAVAVAYYFRFVAPEEERKPAIGPADLQEAMRRANLGRFQKPAVPLNNAVASGLLDRESRGLFKINAVGENLVAMLLPNGNGDELPKRAHKRSSGNGKPRKA